MLFVILILYLAEDSNPARKKQLLEAEDELQKLLGEYTSTLNKLAASPGELSLNIRLPIR